MLRTAEAYRQAVRAMMNCRSRNQRDADRLAEQADQDDLVAEPET
jgi:hypothetical protein